MDYWGWGGGNISCLCIFTCSLMMTEEIVNICTQMVFKISRIFLVDTAKKRHFVSDKSLRTMW